MGRTKISILGAGNVGSTVCQLCAYKELGDLVLWNRTADKAKGLALDLMEALPVEGKDANITGTGDMRDTKDSDIICITAGSQRKEGQSRDELLNMNAKIVKSLSKDAVKYSPNSIILVLTNPLDAMTYVAYKTSKLPREKVSGMAGALDASRFASFVAHELNVSVKDIQGLVLGGHGDFMVPLPEYTNVNGVPITKLIKKDKLNELIKRTRNAGAEIISLEKESSAFYAPAASIVAMIEAIVKDEGRIMPCAAYLNGEYGIKGIVMGVPVKLGANGIEEIIEIDLTKDEKDQLNKSSKAVRELISKLEI